MEGSQTPAGPLGHGELFPEGNDRAGSVFTTLRLSGRALGGAGRSRSASETGPVSGRVAWSSGSLSLSPLIFKMGLMSHLPGHCEDYNQHTVAQGRSQDVPKVTVDRKERSRKGQR